MKKIHFTFSIAAALIALVCFMSMARLGGNTQALAAENVAPATKEYDLNAFGIPLTVTGPEGAELKKGMVNGEMEGIMFMSAEIKKGNFILDAVMADAEPEEDLTDAVAYQRSVAEEDENFKGYILEDEHGYIAKLDDGEEVSYTFNYTVVKGDRHINFMEGLTLHAFTEAEARAMYEAAKTAK